MKRKYKYIDLSGRKLIEKLYLSGVRPADIAEEMEMTTATIYRELERGYTGELDKNGKREYNPNVAQEKIQNSMKQRGRVIKDGGVHKESKAHIADA